ncbi:Piwi domain-containing protein [Hyaloraphidium curvatum]|nr:Piwi domain-containing protein [Hyaloraphidium curvatum]
MSEEATPNPVELEREGLSARRGRDAPVEATSGRAAPRSGSASGERDQPNQGTTEGASPVRPVQPLRFEFAKRPDSGGSAGVGVNCRANFLAMHLLQVADFIIDVVISSFGKDSVLGKVSTRRTLNNLVFAEWQRREQSGDGVLAGHQKAWCLFDGMRILYASRELDVESHGRSFVVAVQDGEERRDFQLTLKRTSAVHGKELIEYQQAAMDSGKPRRKAPPPEFLAALEFLVRQYALASPRLVASGRSFWRPDSRQEIARSVLSMMKGVYGSVRWTEGGTGAAVNVDVSHGAFHPSGPLLPIVRKTLNLQTMPEALNDAQRQAIVSKLRNVLFRVTHRGKAGGKYRLSGLTKTDANTCTFEVSGVQTSAMDYYATVYNLVLNHPKLPLIMVRGTRGVSYFPIELCEILPNQRYLGRLNEDETTALVRFATAWPSDKERDVNHAQETLGLGGNDYLNAFGATVNTKMLQVAARRIRSPRVLYRNVGQGAQFVASDPGTRGFWQLPRDARLLGGARLTGICVAVLADNRAMSVRNNPQDAERNLNAFLRQLEDSCRSHGMRLDRELVVVGPERPAVLRRDLARMVSKAGAACNLLLVVLPTDNAKNPVYTDIKRIADTELGIASQCIKPKWIQGMESSAEPPVGGRGGARAGQRGPPARGTDKTVFSQLVLKINAKLGGQNTAIDGGLHVVSREPTMLLGIDVTHPPPGSQAQSIAAVVASVDRDCSRYHASIALAPSRSETVPDLDKIVVDLINLWRIASTAPDGQYMLPARIICYRDGVSEGQFGRVLDTEVGAIKEAIRWIRNQPGFAGYSPKLTYVIVQKRHHARFFFDADNADRRGNGLPGTVMDRTIVHPDFFEFYLLSHAGIQGTSRATKYIVLFDENKLASDEMQQLTFELCHLFARSQRSVSLPQPVFYSHLVAERARCHLTGGDASETGSTTASAADALPEVKLEALAKDLRTNGSLWFI